METMRQTDPSKRRESERAQIRYCDKMKYPLFAPRGGMCYRCGGNVYDYYKPERSGKTLITSCPYCNASFTD